MQGWAEEGVGIGTSDLLESWFLARVKNLT